MNERGWQDYRLACQINGMKASSLDEGDFSTFLASPDMVERVRRETKIVEMLTQVETAAKIREECAAIADALVLANPATEAEATGSFVAAVIAATIRRAAQAATLGMSPRAEALLALICKAGEALDAAQLVAPPPATAESIKALAAKTPNPFKTPR